jgi:citrate lyase subunit beta / citryl-CoA lyase
MAVDPGDALRTFLFVPGDRPDRIAKAYRSGADCVIVDLEDAVAGARKVEARHSAVAAIGREAQADGPGRTWLAIRVNGAASGLMAQDIAGLAPVWTKLDFIVLPMADVPSVGEVTALMDAVERHGSTSPEGPRIIALIETAESVLNAAGVAAADPRVAALALGPADLAKQLGLTLTADGRELLLARSQLVLAAAAAGLRPPIDGPWFNLRDETGLRTSTEQARRLGFGAKQVLHPRQIGPVQQILAPTAEQIAWAREVDTAFAEAEQRGVASIQLPDGTFVDYPVAHRARALLRQTLRPETRC